MPKSEGARRADEVEMHIHQLLEERVAPHVQRQWAERQRRCEEEEHSG